MLILWISSEFETLTTQPLEFSVEILALLFRIAFNLRTRWIQEKWQEDAVDGTLQERKFNDLLFPKVSYDLQGAVNWTSRAADSGKQ